MQSFSTWAIRWNTTIVLRPGAKQVLKSIRDMNLPDQQAPALGLISDFNMPGSDDSVEGIKASYIAILDQLNIRQFFEPVSTRVTLSTEVGVFKPDPKIFRTALKRIDADAHFHDAVFITENRQHVNAARELGMHAIHVKGADQTEGDVQQLADIVPIGRRRSSGFSPCCKKSAQQLVDRRKRREQEQASGSCGDKDRQAIEKADRDRSRLN